MSLNLYDSTNKTLTPLAGNSRNAVQGATTTADGVAGLVPAPLIADRNKFLKGDGTWAECSGGSGSNTSNFIGTRDEWDLLSQSEKDAFDTMDFTDEYTDAPIDSTPTADSDNLVKSGGVYSAIQALTDQVATKADSSQVQTLANNDNAMLNVLGAKNLLLSAATTQTVGEVTFTVDPEKRIVATNSVTTTAQSRLNIVSGTVASLGLEAGEYIVSVGNGLSSSSYVSFFGISDGSSWVQGAWLQVSPNFEYEFSITDAMLNNSNYTVTFYVRVESNVAAGSSHTFLPMIRPSGVQDSTYVPYAMTNKALTTRILKNPYDEIFVGTATEVNTWVTTSLYTGKKLSDYAGILIMLRFYSNTCVTVTIPMYIFKTYTHEGSRALLYYNGVVFAEVYAPSDTSLTFRFTTLINNYSIVACGLTY